MANPKKEPFVSALPFPPPPEKKLEDVLRNFGEAIERRRQARLKPFLRATVRMIGEGGEDD